MVVKWILRLVVNIILIIVLSTIITYGIGYAFDANFGTSTMVLEMGAILILPYIIGLNTLALISTIFVKETWMKIILTYFPVLFCFALIIMEINAAWTPLTLFTTLFITNTIWIFLIRKTAANNA
mgnify:CR=1 FL=1|tara:strand:+ start:437 stop:811 length:375 start_codon:yes stop_codon:yes gene_type:complete